MFTNVVRKEFPNRDTTRKITWHVQTSAGNLLDQNKEAGGDKVFVNNPDNTVLPGSVNNNVLSATIIDNQGNSLCSFEINKSSDTRPPTVCITSPTKGKTVFGTIDMIANVTNNSEVTKVEFYYDNTNLIGSDTTRPYSVSWNTTAVSNGSH